MSLLDLLPYLAVVAVVAAALGYAWARRDNSAADQLNPVHDKLLQALHELQAQIGRAHV